jgi:hypothetical protein
MLLLWIIYISYCKSKFFLLQTNPNKVIKRINFKKHAQVWFDWQLHVMFNITSYDNTCIHKQVARGEV